MPNDLPRGPAGRRVRAHALPGPEGDCTRRTLRPVGHGGVSRPAGAEWRAALPTGHCGARSLRRGRTVPAGMRQHAPTAGFPITTQRPYPSSAATWWAAQLLRSSGLRRRPINGTLRDRRPARRGPERPGRAPGSGDDRSPGIRHGHIASPRVMRMAGCLLLESILAPAAVRPSSRT